jgi:hypothetical protein
MFKLAAFLCTVLMLLITGSETIDVLNKDTWDSADALIIIAALYFSSHALIYFHLIFSPNEE